MGLLWEIRERRSIPLVLFKVDPRRIKQCIRDPEQQPVQISILEVARDRHRMEIETVLQRRLEQERSECGSLVQLEYGSVVFLVERPSVGELAVPVP